MSQSIDIMLSVTDDYSDEFSTFRASLKKTNRELDKSEDRFRNFARAAKTAIMAVGAFVAARAVVTSIAQVTESFANLGHEAASIGMATDEMQRLEFAASQTGVEFEDLVGGIEEYRIRLAEAAQDGSGPLSDTFKKLGLDARDMMQKPITEQLGILADNLNKLSATDRQFIADEIFGGDAKKMMEFLNLGSEGINKLGEDAEALGVVLGTESVKAAQDFQRALSELSQVGKSTFMSMMTPVVQWVSSVVRELSLLIGHWNLTWDIIKNYFFLSLVMFGNEFAHTFTQKLPAILQWFGKNFFELMRGYVTGVVTLFVELGKTIGDIIWELPGLIQAALTGGDTSAIMARIGDAWSKDFMEGFEMNLSELKIPERELTKQEEGMIARGAALESQLNRLRQEQRQSLESQAQDGVDLVTSGVMGPEAPSHQGDGTQFGMGSDKGGQDKALGTQGSGDRFLQTGRSISVTPEKETAESTKRTAEACEDMNESINTLNGNFESFMAQSTQGGSFEGL